MNKLLRMPCGCICVLDIKKQEQGNINFDIQINHCFPHANAGQMMRALQAASREEKLSEKTQKLVDEVLAKVKTSWD